MQPGLAEAIFIAVGFAFFVRPFWQLWRLAHPRDQEPARNRREERR